MKKISKTSQLGTKPGETRATFIVKESDLEKLKELAYYERKTIKDLLSEIFDDYFKSLKERINKHAYKG